MRYFFFAMAVFLSIGIVSDAAALKWMPAYTPELFQDYPNHFVKYRYQNTPDHLTFESAGTSVTFEKSDCTLRLFRNGTVTTGETPFISSVSQTMKEAANGTDAWLSSDINSEQCVFSGMEYGSGLMITGTRRTPDNSTTFKTDYNIDYSGIVKETITITNDDPAKPDTKFGYSEIIRGNFKVTLGNETYTTQDLPNDISLGRAEIEGKTLTIVRDGFTIQYDPQNYVHDYLWAVKIQNGQIVLDYTNSKGRLKVGDSLVIDPTYIKPTGLTIQGTWSIVPTDVTVARDGNFSSYDATQRGQKNLGAQTGAWVYSFPNATVIGIHWKTRGAQDIAASNGGATVDTWTGTAWTVRDTIANYIFGTLANDATYGIEDRTITGFTATNTNKIRIELVRNGASDVAARVYELFYAVMTKPNAVINLHDTATSTTSVDLAWTAPDMNGGTCSGYQINYTTPWGIPSTILVNDTGSCASSYSVTGLVIATDYSFRVSARNNLGTNVTGANILNVTTAAFNQANYTIGSFNFQANNPLIFPIRYERIDNGTSDTRVNVTFANTISLACDLRYTYAGTNHTYHSISSIPVSLTENEASFHFTNSSNDITTFHCWNQNGNQSANYVLTQTDFLLKQQVRDFRNGTYGTMGQFGAFDLITLIIVIISMIGLNRNTEAVAGIFCIAAISVLAYFDIVSWITAIVAAACVIMLFMVAGTRKT